MAFKTKLQVETKIKRDLDLEEEEFIQALELTEYVNDAITIVEAHINTLGLRDQYFLTRSTVNLVTGTADYALPSNLYEDKIKEVVYSVGATIYKVEPMTTDRAAEEIEHLNRFSTTQWYKYRIRRDSASANYLQLIPVSRETTTAAIIIEFFRDIARVVNDADLVEIPDIALQYLYQFVKVRVYEKESHANYQLGLVELEKLEGLMISTLQGQLADNSNNKLELDKTVYEEMS